MTTFYLIRHATNDLVGNTIAGRSPGVHLNADGRHQAEQLAKHLADRPVQSVFTSPLERARETAEPLARTFRVTLQVVPAFNEINFGDFTGRTFDSLEKLPAWKHWNQFRSGLRIPNGELMSEVQARMVGGLEQLSREFRDQSVAIVSHGDPLRTAIAYYLGMPLDLHHRIEISPASLTILTLNDWGPKIDLLNATWPTPGAQ